MRNLKVSLYRLPLSLFATMIVLLSSVKPSYAGASAIDVLVQMGVSKVNSWINKALNSLLGLGACKGNGQISDVICNVMESSAGIPGFISALAYILGLILAVSALFKLKEHVLDPSRTPLSDSVKRFVAGGAFFALPMVTEASQNLLTKGNMAMSKVTLYNGSTGGGSGLDGMLVALFLDIYEPLMSIIFAFGYLAGLVLTMVGIGRLIKTAQDGPRGPASMGTVMTFIIAGVLFSLSNIMGAFSNSMFQSSTVATFAVLETSTGDVALDGHVLAMISTILVFMTIIGYISFMRGFFIIKDVAEGSGQASLMAGVTHIFGGALAVNLGPLLNAVQTTLGLNSFGITFY